VKHALVLPLLLALGACAAKVTPPTVEFPVLDDLSAETQKPCPPLDAVTGSLGDLATKDVAAAAEYAKCRARAATAVGAYGAAQRLLRAAQAKAEAQHAAKKP
jgi:hypothetical protein